jgi:ribosomal protein L30
MFVISRDISLENRFLLPSILSTSQLSLMCLSYNISNKISCSLLLLNAFSVFPFIYLESSLLEVSVPLAFHSIWKITLLRSFSVQCSYKRENMNAFKAFKAQVPIAWSPHLYITLVRGIPGTRRLHRRTLEALRLHKCNRTVMRWNTPTAMGMLQQVLV